jgi:hypothetical protein
MTYEFIKRGLDFLDHPFAGILWISHKGLGDDLGKSSDGRPGDGGFGQWNGLDAVFPYIVVVVIAKGG